MFSPHYFSACVLRRLRGSFAFQFHIQLL